MITMAEIARLTGVSQPTVSRVLNGNKAVDPAIRERVLACAREHDYQLNVLAKGLQGSKTNLLGVLVTDISNSFFSDLVKEIETQARNHGYSIILFNSDYNPQRQREYIDVVRRYRVDGLLMVPTLRDPALWQECAGKLDVPAVAITRQVEGFDSIYLDHREAAEQVARHLVEQGYERFLFVGKEKDLKYQGFRDELERLGIDTGERIGCFEVEDNEAFLATIEHGLRVTGGRTGIFAQNDIWALRVLKALQDLGLSVPRDAGVVGFDDTSLGRVLYPGLSSVSQPIAQMAEEAVSRLIHRIEHSEETEILDHPLHATLMARTST